MASVINGEDPEIPGPPQLEAVYAAIRCDDPGRLLGVAVDRPQQVQSQKTDRPCM